MLHGFANLQRAAVGLLLPGDHPEQRRLAGAVRPDHADDAAARQREVEAVDQQVVAVALAQAARFDDDVAEPGTRRNVDFGGFNFLRGVFAQQLLVGVEARLSFRLARARRHANPFELAFERALTPGLGLFLLRETILFLLEPRRVVALPRNAPPAIELENPAGDVVQEVAIVGDGDDGARVVLQKALEPGDRFRVEMVGRLVEQQQIRRLQQQPAQARPGVARRLTASTTSASGGGSRSASIASSRRESRSQAFDASILS